MTIHKYIISQPHRDAVRAAGFDIADPNRRHPVRNVKAEKILAARQRQHQQTKSRADALLKSRAGRALERTLGRVLGAFAALSFGLDNVVHASEAVSTAPLADALWQLDLPGIAHPVWPLLLLGLNSILLWLILRKLRFLGYNPEGHGSTGEAGAKHDRPIKKGRAASTDKSKSIKKGPGNMDIKYKTEPEQVSSSPIRWITDGATRTGKVRSENQDAFRILTLSETRQCLILCDGAGGVAGGGIAARLTARAIEQAMKIRLDDEPPSMALLEEAIVDSRAAIAKIPEAGITTALIALLDGDQLFTATLGDGGMSVIWPDGMIGEVLVPHHILGEPSNVIAGYVGHGCAIPPRLAQMRLEPGSFIMLMSDGASDLFPYDEFARNREAYGKAMQIGPEGLANRFLAELEEARDPNTGAYLHSDNMTFLIAHGEFAPAHRLREGLA